MQTFLCHTHTREWSYKSSVVYYFNAHLLVEFAWKDSLLNHSCDHSLFEMVSGPLHAPNAILYNLGCCRVHKGRTATIVLGLICPSVQLSFHLSISPSVCHTFSGAGHNSKSNQCIVLMFGAISSQVG